MRALAGYKDFLTLWKESDPDIPIYKQAKAEYAKLQLNEFLCAKGDGCEDGAEDAPPQRRFYHAGNLRAQHERRSSSSAG